MQVEAELKEFSKTFSVLPVPSIRARPSSS